MAKRARVKKPRADKRIDESLIAPCQELGEPGYRRVGGTLHEYESIDGDYISPHDECSRIAYEVQADEEMLSDLGMPTVSRYTRASEAESIKDLHDDERGWRAGNNTSDDFAIRVADAQRQSLYYWLRHPLARNILRAYQFMIVGGGLMLDFPGKAAAKVWEKWATDNNWEARYRRIVLNACIFGEQPLVLYPLSAETVIGDAITGTVDDTVQRLDPVTRSLRERKTKRTHVRMFDPREIAEVRTRADDGEELEYVKRTFRNRTYKYAPDDVVMFTVNLTGMSPRGRPVLEPVLRLLQWIHGFMQDRVLLHAFRTRIPIIRKVNKGGTTGVAREGAKFSTLPRAGTVLTTSMAGEEWTYPGLNINAGDAMPDFRMLVQTLAAGVNLPAFMVTGDASTANKASLQEASESIRPMFDELKSMFADRFADTAERIVGVRPSAQFSSGERRDSLDRTRAGAIGVQQRLVSRTTTAASMGRKWRDELELLAEEERLLVERGLSPDPLVALADSLPDVVNDTGPGPQDQAAMDAQDQQDAEDAGSDGEA